MNFNNNNNKHISPYMRRGWGDRGANKKNAKKKSNFFFLFLFSKEQHTYDTLYIFAAASTYGSKIYSKKQSKIPPR